MFHIILYEPEIPPNTGNIIRLAANTGSQVHLIKPLGFSIDDKHLKRAGLDYHEFANLFVYDNYQHFSATTSFKRLFPVSTKGKQQYHEVKFEPSDAFMFGPETRGLPSSILSDFESSVLRIPMKPNNRSINLANAVSIIIYEAWRQNSFL